MLPDRTDRDTPIFEDVAADGERVLLNVPDGSRSTVSFHVALHWTAMLKEQSK